MNYIGRYIVDILAVKLSLTRFTTLNILLNCFFDEAIMMSWAGLLLYFTQYSLLHENQHLYYILVLGKGNGGDGAGVDCQVLLTPSGGVNVSTLVSWASSCARANLKEGLKNSWQLTAVPPMFWVLFPLFTI